MWIKWSRESVRKDNSTTKTTTKHCAGYQSYTESWAYFFQQAQPVDIVDHIHWFNMSQHRMLANWASSLRWRRNGHGGVSNHQPHHYLLNRLFVCRSKKTSKLRVTGLCAGNSPETGEFPAQMAIYAENISIWWRHHEEQIIDDERTYILVSASTRMLFIFCCIILLCIIFAICLQFIGS